jgi:polyphosphate kinase 2 (PPK2 family)
MKPDQYQAFARIPSDYALGRRAMAENVAAKLKRKDYETELRKLQAELCDLQDCVKATCEWIVIVFEGREAIGHK